VCGTTANVRANKGTTRIPAQQDEVARAVRGGCGVKSALEGWVELHIFRHAISARELASRLGVKRSSFSAHAVITALSAASLHGAIRD
jgi:predicted XRE-type DNA-binding protein